MPVQGEKSVDGALARDEGSVDHSRESKHGKASVLELSELVTSAGLGVLAEAEGIKSKVSRGASSREHSGSRHLKVVGEVLNGTDESEDLPESASGNLVEGLGSNGVGGCLERKVNKLLHNVSQGGEHANTAVLELRLAEPLDVILGGEAKRVKSNISDHLAIQRSGAGEEGDGLGHLLHLHACKPSISERAVKRPRRPPTLSHPKFVPETLKISQKKLTRNSGGLGPDSSAGKGGGKGGGSCACSKCDHGAQHGVWISGGGDASPLSPPPSDAFLPYQFFP